MTAIDSNIIIACATVIAALLGIIGSLLMKILANTRRTHEQVANNHVDEDGNPINMRDDLDEKFAGVAGLVKDVKADVGGMKEDLRLVRRDQTADRAVASEAHKIASEAIGLAQQAIERTKPKHQIQGEKPSE